MGGWLNPRTLGWAQDALRLVYVAILAAAWRKRTRAWDGRRHPGPSAPDADMAGNRLATDLGSSFSLQIVG